MFDFCTPERSSFLDCGAYGNRVDDTSEEIEPRSPSIERAHEMMDPPAARQTRPDAPFKPRSFKPNGNEEAFSTLRDVARANISTQAISSFEDQKPASHACQSMVVEAGRLEQQTAERPSIDQEGHALEKQVVGKPTEVLETSHVTVAQGVPYRVDPKSVSKGDLAYLNKFPDSRQANKLQIIQDGGDLATRFPLFPATRAYQDKFGCVLATVFVLLGSISLCVYLFTGDVFNKLSRDGYPTLLQIALAGGVACFTSAGVAAAFMRLAKDRAACVVWTSLICGPCLTIAAGVFFLGISKPILGIIFISLGAMSLFCVFFCWRRLIPFTIKLVETIASIVVWNPMMLGVSLLGTMLGVGWSFVVIVPVVGFYIENMHDVTEAPKALLYIVYFLIMLFLSWGSLVAYNISHVTYCGIFGRWYFGRDKDTSLRLSFEIALTTSFGTICLGSLLVAVVRALETTVRLVRKDAQENESCFICILLLIVECIIGCIGDFLEYFSEWAYVQVAVRGVSFLQAVKVTFSLCTCANVQYIMQDLLINSVVNLGALLCGVFGALAGGLVIFPSGLIAGLYCGIVAGGFSMGMISSGAKTILSLWAERPNTLQARHPDIHEQFVDKIYHHLSG